MAVETKWSASSWCSADAEPRVRRAAQRAHESARDLSYWHNLRSLGVGEVKSAVFLWGRDADMLDPSAGIGGTAVVPGLHATAWRQTLGRDQLSTDQVDAVWKALAEQCRKRDPLEAEKYPTPPSLAEWAVRVVVVLAAVYAGLLVTAAAISSGAGWLWSLLGVLCVLLAGAGTACVRHVRYIALAWLTGAVVTLVLVAAFSLHTRL